MNEQSAFPWKRRWFETTAALNGASETYGVSTGRGGEGGVSLDDIRDTPCVVLLGAPGLGKTNEMRRAAALAAERNEECQFISLGRLSSPNDLENKIRQFAQDKQLGSKVWNIFLDGLDEALFQFGHNAQIIPNAFQSLSQTFNIEALRIRISCRSAEWPAEIQSELQSLWGKENFKIYELGGLTEVDQKLAAGIALGPSAAEFLEQLQRHDAALLASRPVTLIMLLNVFRKNDSLPAQQVQLYRQALLTSLEEANATRRAVRQLKRLDAQSKLMVASRIAAASIFSNSFEIWTGLQSETPGRAMALSTIAGGYEPVLGMSFAVGETELYEALHSPLFERASEDLFVWSHKTFAEFLAGYYLIERDLTEAEMLHVLCAGNAARVPPQLREVAAWLASMNPDFFREIIKSEPDILLRSDVASADVRDRSNLVRELLLRLERAELHDFDFGWRSRFDRLRHPGLADQLHPYITGKDKNVVSRRVAISIAEENGCLGLEAILASVALDVSDDLHIRDRAARALSKSQNAKTLVHETLRKFLSPNYTGDLNDDLKGSALSVLWPDHLTIRQLLESLTPRKVKNYFGVYASFVSCLDVPKLSSSDAIEVLDWLSEANTEDSTFRRLVTRLLSRIWENAEDTSVLKRLADYISFLVSESRWFGIKQIESTLLPEIGAADTKRRRSLISSIVSKGSKRSYAWLVFSGPAPLILPEDMPWLVEQLQSDNRTLGLETATELALALSSRLNIDDLFPLWVASESVPELARALERAYSVDLGSSTAEWQKEDFQNQQRRAAEQEKHKFDALRVMEDQLEKIEIDDSFGWWELNLYFFLDENGQLDDELHSDLTATQLWASLPRALQERIASAGKRYLVENKLGRLDWLGTNTFNRPAAAGYRAFRLLFTLNRLSELSVDVWRNWASALISSSFNEDEGGKSIQRALFGFAYKYAPAAVLRSLARLLLKSQTQFTVSSVIELLAENFDPQLGRLLWNVLARYDDGEVRSIIAEFLARNLYPAAVDGIDAAINSEMRELAPQLRDENMLVFGLAGLIRAEPRNWQRLVRLKEHNESIAWKVVENLASRSYDQNSFIDGLNEQSLAELYSWCFKRLPPSATTKSDSARFLGVPDHVDHLRNYALRRLVSIGTSAAIVALQRLVSELPGQPWLKFQLVDARRALDAKSWERREPADVITEIALLHPTPPPHGLAAAFAQTNIARGEMPIGPAKAIPAESFSPTFELAPSEVVAAIKPRRILCVSSDWSSTHGGIATFNREFCKALAAIGHEVRCFVLDPTYEEVNDANAANVGLIGAPRSPDPLLGPFGRLLLFSRSQIDPWSPEIVVGHDQITGTAAQQIAQRIYNIPYVHFVHTLPEEIEPFKTRAVAELLRGANKAEVQTWQCKQAQLVVAIGSRIYRDIYMKLSGGTVRVVEVLPGMNKRLLSNKVDLSKPRTLHCLLFARLEDADLKGASLACKMIKVLREGKDWPIAKKPSLVLRGFDPAKAEKEATAIEGFAEAKEYLFARPYTADGEVLANEICTASLVVMPSKREGFGLAGLEAIAAGVPVLVSSESGLADLLMDHPALDGIRDYASSCVLEVAGDRTIKWAECVNSIVSDLSSAFVNAEKLRMALVPSLTWDRTAREFTKEVEAIKGL